MGRPNDLGIESEAPSSVIQSGELHQDVQREAASRFLFAGSAAMTRGVAEFSPPERGSRRQCYSGAPSPFGTARPLQLSASVSRTPRTALTKSSNLSVVFFRPSRVSDENIPFRTVRDSSN